MKTLVDSVKDPSEAERKGGMFGVKGIIPFIPEAIDPSLEERGCVEFVVKVNQSGTLSKNNSVKRRIQKFSYGTTEELLRWKRELDSIIASKPVTDPMGKFNTAELILSDDPLNTFKEYRRGVCESIPNVPGGQAPGETNETFQSVVNRFLGHYFPKAHRNPAGTQKKYMRCHLKKPRGVRVNQVFLRIYQMNALLPLFPEPDNHMFTDLELVDIIITMMPQQWQHQMAKSLNFEPTEATLPELQTALEKLELLDDVESKKDGGDSSKNKSSKDKSNKQKGQFKHEQKSKKFKANNGKECPLCSVLGGKADNHTLESCYFKDKVKKLWKQGSPRDKTKGYNDKAELNALITKKANKIIKKTFKRSGVEYVPETSSSDSDGSE